MLTPEIDDKNRKIELERKKQNPAAFGVSISNGLKNLPTTGGLVQPDRENKSLKNADAEKHAAELKTWAERTVSLNFNEIITLIQTAERSHLEALIVAEMASKKRKHLIDELNAALVKLL